MGPVCLDGTDGHDRHRLRPVEVANLLPGQVREVEDCHRVAVSYRARRLTASRPRPISVTMSFQPPEQFNIADYFLDARVREGKGQRPAVLTDTGTLTYREIQALANRFGHVFTESGVEPEQRVMIALPDGPGFVGALFGTLKIGAAVVMANPQLKPDAIEYFYAYPRPGGGRPSGHGCRVPAGGAWRASLEEDSCPRGQRIRRAARPRPCRARPVPDPSRRRRDLAVLGRHHGTAEGRGADPHVVREHD